MRKKNKKYPQFAVQFFKMLTQFSCNLKGKKVEQNIYLSVALSKSVQIQKF